jgi:hypothetical protein
MDLEPGVTLNMIIVAHGRWAALRPSAHVARLGDETLSDFLRASEGRLTAVPTSVSAVRERPSEAK